jgi:flagellar basal-body rod protein FlgF
MENTGYVALSYAVGLQNKMDLVANNIANVDTNGYKSSHIMFDEYIVNAKKQKPLSMVQDYGNYRDTKPGPIDLTGNPLDVALQGNGFLSVATATGERYTRNGSMTTNALGQLTNSSGELMNDTGGKPIVIPEGSQMITISDNGTVSTQEGPVGQLRVVRFDDPQQLKPVGNDAYETTQAGIPDLTTRVKQGALEGSNVNPVMEMTDMIEVMRKYESVARILQTEHDSQINMITKLSRV